MEVVIVGFALFSLFFGAGNLIFPPFLGKIYGSNWLIASLGFILTGVGLASIAIFSMAKKSGDIKVFTEVAGKKLGYTITLIIALTIGPLGAIPRTGATSGEVIIASGIDISYALFILLFFGLALTLILTDSKIIDIIGKYLTPSLLIVLMIMIVAGIINPIGSFIKSDISKANTFTNSAIEGYNTMDALASIAFAPIIIKSLIDKGCKENIVKKTVEATLIAAGSLILVYISLTYLGASSSLLYQDISSRVELLIKISNSTLGSFGKYVLSAIIVLACFTTAVGLISSIAEILHKNFLKISYKTFAITITLISIILSLVGVDKIVNYTSPLLTFIYPIVILMIIFNLSNPKMTEKYRHMNFVIVGIISFIQSLISYISMANENLAKNFSKIISFLPFYDYGFPWIVPFLIIFVIGLFMSLNQKKCESL